jgi:hypothetical protein
MFTSMQTVLEKALLPPAIATKEQGLSKEVARSILLEQGSTELSSDIGASIDRVELQPAISRLC